jgi:hypothetical protein
VLYLDCDTHFVGDVAALFDHYSIADFYAREEPHSSRSPLGSDPNYLNERRLGQLARAEGVRVVPPYNLGVCLMNNRAWISIASTRSKFLRLVSRFIVGLHLADGADIHLPTAVRLRLERRLTSLDRSTALSYPSSNTWIVEQVAMWLALGSIPGFTHGRFSPKDVAQGAEFMKYKRGGFGGTLCHYFSRNEDQFRTWSSDE